MQINQAVGIFVLTGFVTVFSPRHADATPIDGAIQAFANENDDDPQAARPEGDDGALPRSNEFSDPSIVLARNALAAGQIETALSHLQAAVDADPTLPPPVLLMAYIYLAHHRLEETAMSLEKAAALYKEHPEVYQACGEFALRRGRHADAWAHIQTALRLEAPDNWPAAQRTAFRIRCLAGLAAISERRSDWLTAAQMFAQMDQLRPLGAGELSRWGESLFKSGDEGSAFSKFAQAHETDPAINPPELALAAIHTGQGEFDQAQVWHEKAIKNHPDDGRVYFEYAGSLLLAGQAAQSAAQLEAADKAGADLSQLALDVTLLRGLIARADGDFEKAEEHFKAALRAAPGQSTALYQLPLVLVEQGEAKHAQALQIASIHTQKRPNSVDAWTALGWVQFKLKKPQEAEESLLKAASGSAKQPETLYYLAQVLLANNKAVEAKPYIDMLREQLTQPQLFILRDEAMEWIDSVSLALD